MGETKRRRNSSSLASLWIWMIRTIEFYRVRVGVGTGILRVDPLEHFKSGLGLATLQQKFRAFREGEQPKTEHE